MLGFDEIDLLVRGGFLALMTTGAWIIWRDQRQALAARVSVLLNVSACAFILTTLPGLADSQSVAADALRVVSGATTGLFWLFARTWFRDVGRVSWRSWSVALGPAALNGLLVVTGLDSDPQVYRLWNPFLTGITFVLLAWALVIAWSQREDDLIELRRRLRTGIVVTSGLFGLLFTCLEIAITRFGASPELRSLAMAGLALAAVPIFLAMQGVRQPDLFGPASKAKPMPEGAGLDDPLVARLLAHMEAQKPHRNEVLTIAMLAGQLGEQEYRLRRLINGALGYRNFSEFLNTYRLAEVKDALTNPAQREVPILTIALDAGFGSLSSFNRVFRDAEGVTPSDYRRKACPIPELG